MSLDVMRKTPLTRLRQIRLRIPLRQISTFLNLDKIERLTKRSALAKPDTLENIYSFSGAGGVSDQLAMRPKKSTKGLGNYPFLFLEKKQQRNNFESAYSDKPQLATSGTNHTKTIPNGRN